MMTRDDKVVDFPNSEERARRLKVEVERLARLPLVEWMFYLDDTAKKHGIASAKLKAMIEGVIKAAEKKEREDQAEDRQRRTARRETTDCNTAGAGTRERAPAA